MKKIILIACGIVFSLTLLAQPPQGINYQAVVRNSSGEIVSNDTVNFKFHLRIGSETGDIEYTETQDILTDQFGLASLVIGNGTPETGTFDTIDWSGGNIWIEVEMDPANTYSYVSMGAEQFQSVPYAINSGSDWNVSGDDLYYNEGNVGIGTSAPNAKLEVVGDVFVNNNDLGVEQSIFLGPSSPTVSIGREAGSRTMLLKSGVDGMVSGTGFKFLINDEDKLILDSLGNLGIGGRIEVFNTGNSVFIGEGAGANANNDSPYYQNVAIGNSALYSNTTGSLNTATGYSSLYSNTTGIFNTANGHSSLYSNTEGKWNAATGFESLKDNTTGYHNTATGAHTLQHNTTSSYNTANGFKALYFNTTGGYNTAIGTSALENNTTGYFNTAVGWNADVGAGNLSYATAIGAYAYVESSFSLVLGAIAGVNGASTSTNVGIGTTTPSNRLSVSGDADISGNLGIGTSSPSERLHVEGNMRLAGSLYDTINEPGTSGQVLSSTGGGGVVWASPYPAWVAVDNNSYQDFSNSDEWRILCSVEASDFEEGHTVKLEANMMLKMSSGSAYDEFDISIFIDCGSGPVSVSYISYFPDTGLDDHKCWKIVSILDLHIVPCPGPITYSVRVRNLGDDPWECAKVQFIATQMD